MEAVDLEFYVLPFKVDKYSGWVRDSKDNFCFELDDSDCNTNQDFIKLMRITKDVVFSLNSVEHEPIEGLLLSIDPDDNTLILNHDKPFIQIRGWGNLTGIGGYNFDGDKASKIQDNLRDYIIYKLTNK